MLRLGVVDVMLKRWSWHLKEKDWDGGVPRFGGGGMMMMMSLRQGDRGGPGCSH
jgi:hypothetical protein